MTAMRIFYITGRFCVKSVETPHLNPLQRRGLKLRVFIVLSFGEGWVRQIPMPFAIKKLM